MTNITFWPKLTGNIKNINPGKALAEMDVILSLNNNRPCARFDNKTNALSVLLETEGTGLITHLQNHIMLSKQKEWLGNSTRCKPKAGDLYCIALQEDTGTISEITLPRNALLEVINRWHRFTIEQQTQQFTI